ncbi:MAG: PD40 domain-containing protein [Chloroflexi bacterium]|nr:PD40 domain-containing protein [Chloroflexota bacterium]
MKKSVLLLASLLLFNGSASLGRAQTPTGKIVHISSGGLSIFDLVTGTDRLLTSLGGINPKLSIEGTKVAFAIVGGKKSNTGLYVINSDGTGLTRLTTFGLHPAWSPDGAKIAFANNGIWVVDANGGAATRLTDHGAWPAFSPDGAQIAFCSTKNSGDYDLWIMNADGTNTEALLSQAGADIDLSWSPSSKLVFSHYVDRKSSYDLCVLDPIANTLTRFANPGGDTWPSWSPDGAWIAFDKAGTSSANTYIMRADGSVPPIFVTNGGQPSWGP